MLASAVEDIAKLKYTSGILASVKLDGIRALIINGSLVSRTFKQIPNKYIRQKLSIPELEGLDGELVVGSTFQESSSGVMSMDGKPDFTYFVFDHVQGSLSEPFEQRLKRAKLLCEKFSHLNLKFVEHKLVKNQEELSEYEEKVVSEGYEGVMIRLANSPYKCGRSSLKEGYLGKIKRHVSEEYLVVGFLEQMHNANEAEEDAFGRTKRSSVQANMIPKDTLGALIVKSKEGLEFQCGTGFDNAIRKEIWDNRKDYLGKLVKIKSFLVGVKDAPRFPVFEGFRHQEDM